MLFSFWVWRPGCRSCTDKLGIEYSNSIAESRYLDAVVDSTDRAQLNAPNNFVSRSADRDFHFHKQKAAVLLAQLESRWRSEGSWSVASSWICGFDIDTFNNQST